MTTPGRKDDNEKLRYHLLDPIAIAWLVASLTFGAQKYAEENWRSVENWLSRYYDALMRHLEAWRSGAQASRTIRSLDCLIWQRSCSARCA